MLQTLIRTYFTRVFYVQLSPQRLTVRNVLSGEQISEVPEIAIANAFKSKARMVAVGAAAAAAAGETDVKVVNPFAHPRSLVSDFTVAEQVLRTFIRRLRGSDWYKPAPDIVMHPLGEWEGGLTQVELRALRELALGAGANEVGIWQGRALTDAEVLARQFPPEGSLGG